MDLVSVGARVVPKSLASSNPSRSSNPNARSAHRQPFQLRCPFLSPPPRNSSLSTRAKRKDSKTQPVKQSTTLADEYQEEEEVGEEYDEDDGIEDFGDDEMLLDGDEDFEDDFETEDEILYVGDGGGGGGISLAGTWWDKEALTIAEEVSMSFDGDLKIYAFKTSANCIINLRIEKLSTKYGSPSISDIQAFSSAYRARLDEAEITGTIPKDISLEVSSPGVERVVRIPEDLERFKEKPMFVKYTNENAGAASSPQENDGIFRLVAFDLESCHCTWGVADVRVNREKAGKGRPLSKKQREWRLQTPFDSLRLVRIYSEC